jgi:hypothetical protein
MSNKKAKITDRNMTDAELEQAIDKIAALPRDLDEDERWRREVMITPRALWADGQRLLVLWERRAKRMQRELEQEKRKLEAIERDIGMSRN